MDCVRTKIPEQKVSLKLPDAIKVDEEKALGVLWIMKEENFYVKPGINNEERDLISKEMKLVLTLRISLSIHAKTYDLLGLVLPTRIIGNLLFRKYLQTIKNEQKGKIPWNEEMPGNLISL